jgi:hypothetical protein
VRGDERARHGVLAIARELDLVSEELEELTADEAIRRVVVGEQDRERRNLDGRLLRADE